MQQHLQHQWHQTLEPVGAKQPVEVAKREEVRPPELVKDPKPMQPQLVVSTATSTSMHTSLLQTDNKVPYQISHK